MQYPIFRYGQKEALFSADMDKKRAPSVAFMQGGVRRDHEVHVTLMERSYATEESLFAFSDLADVAHASRNDPTPGFPIRIGTSLKR